MDSKIEKILWLLMAALGASAILGLPNNARAKSKLHFGLHVSGHSGHHSYGHYAPHSSYYRYKRYHSPHYGHYRYRRYRSRHYKYDRYPSSYHRLRQERSSTSDYRSRSEKGWAYLAKGRAHSALSIFATEASRYPNAGLPKVGYALAKAMRHDDARAVWAMRRALKYKPKALDRIPDDKRLHYQLGKLVDRYHHRSGAGSSDQDKTFMTAALAYIQGDYELASKAIDQRMRLGDPHTTALTLQKMINRKKPKGRTREYN